MCRCMECTRCLLCVVMLWLHRAYYSTIISISIQCNVLAITSHAWRYGEMIDICHSLHVTALTVNAAFPLHLKANTLQNLYISSAVLHAPTTTEYQYGGTCIECPEKKSIGHVSIELFACSMCSSSSDLLDCLHRCTSTHTCKV